MIEGADMAQQFMNFTLIDEFFLFIHPVILGSGKPLFQEGKNRINLYLESSITFASGAIMLKYIRTV